MRAVPAVGTATSSREAGDPQVIEQVRRAQHGSAHAFAVLYDHYVDRIYAYVYHRVGHRQTAEDLVGDVFLRALRRITSFHWQGVDFGAWLMTIARNRVNDHYKSARFRLEASVEEVFDTATTGGPEDPEQAVLTGDLARQVHEALSRLKGEQAEVLYLRFIQHLNVAETGAVMGKSEGAVKALQYRALKSLAKQIPNGLRRS
ncbi:MAG TPA: sigma-70 family RNA polymerase sigma factor [Egibacteraceae bacterium]|nr:sigma-70 family RNA polymerase sigma factor [Actinomycetota bacterium]HWB71619.1 sigma-70 family RNA polymerase sigma factor [Egibacteraceae bacterium]